MEMSLKRLVVEMHAQLKIAGPVCLTFILRKSIDVVSIIFVGHLDGSQRSARHLSSCGLATVTSNVTGIAILVGMGGALSTLASQANGARDAEALNASLQQALVILPTLVCIPVSLLWLFAEPIMQAFGQEEVLARDASRYLFILIPSLFFTAGSICIQNWLHAQARTAAVAVVTACMAFLHPLWCWLFIYEFGFGFLGAALAVSLSRALELCALAWYLRYGTTLLMDVGFIWSLSQATQNWTTFLGLGLPNVIMMSPSELIIFLAGALVNPETQVSAVSIFQSTITLCFMLPSGLSVSGATRCGNALGLSDANSAAKAAVASPILGALVSTTVAGILMALHTSWALIFTQDSAVVSAVSHILPILVIYVVADGVQGALTGIIKGLGKQRLGGPLVVFSYYVVGLPLSISLGFNWSQQSLNDGWGIYGLCIGTTVGALTHASLFALVVARTNWMEEVERVTRRIQKEMRGGAEAGEGVLIDMDSSPTRTDGGSIKSGGGKGSSSSSNRVPSSPKLTSSDGITSIFDADLDDDDWNDSFDSFTNFGLYGASAEKARPMMQRVTDTIGSSSIFSVFRSKAAMASEYELVQTHLDPLSGKALDEEEDDLIF